MSSDADYEAFLNKANQDVSSAPQAATTSSRSKRIQAGSTKEVSAHLSTVDAYMTTDSDEPFEQFSLEFDADKLPSGEAMSELVGTAVESISEKDFDPRGQYSEVVEAVKKAGDGQVGFYRAQLDSTRTEYIIVSVNAEQRLLLGFKVLAVES